MAAVSFNKAILVGNTGRDAEVRYTPNGHTVARFPLATHSTWLDEQGARQQQTDWHSIVVWGKQAEACGHYLTKGRLVYVEGALRSRSYDTPEGEHRFVVEIVAHRVQFLGGGNGAKAGEGEASGIEEGAAEALSEEEVPF